MKKQTIVKETNFPGLLHRGKVRDTYDLGNRLLLMVATDRISAFDIVLPTPVPDKGVILANLSKFWFSATEHLLPNHLVAMADSREGKEIIATSGTLILPDEVISRSMIVQLADRVDVECVARGYITGSAWAEYKRTGTVNGQEMPAGLVEGDRFPEPLFTPTTKADEGHDEPISIEELCGQVGEEFANTLHKTTLNIYQWAHDFALSRGIIIADTKIEFGLRDEKLIIIDELLTPDSSRFWDKASYQPGQSPPNFDKQFVRDWLTEAGWDREPPAPELSDEVIQYTRARYLDAYSYLTGKTLF